MVGITRHMKGRFAEVLSNWPARDIRFICVSTGGRILVLGLFMLTSLRWGKAAANTIDAMF